MATTTLDSEGEVRSLFEAHFSAIRSTDPDRIMANYAADVVAYDAILQLEFRGRDAYAAHWKACLEMCENMTFESQGLNLAVAGDLALAHGLVRCGGTDAEGKEHTGLVRATWGGRRRDGRWQIVHEHFSLPFDPGTMKVLDQLEA